jgi:hypothetical protein
MTTPGPHSNTWRDIKTSDSYVSLSPCFLPLFPCFYSFYSSFFPFSPPPPVAENMTTPRPFFEKKFKRSARIRGKFEFLESKLHGAHSFDIKINFFAIQCTVWHKKRFFVFFEL